MAARLHHGDDDLGELHEINVTPFIDVILAIRQSRPTDRVSFGELQCHHDC